MESHNRFEQGNRTRVERPNLEPLRDPGHQTDPLVFIAGMGRSGSTLLDRLLGQLPGWWSLGEVVHLWTRGLRDNERCGCGERFLDCEVWMAIGEKAFGGWRQVDADSMEQLRLSVERDRHIPFLLAPRLRPGFMADALTYSEVVGRVYDAAREVTGASVIVDSSKHVPAALLLRLNPKVDLRLLHLVRDSRGVAYSWSKSVARPATDGATEMARWSPFQAATRYLGYNTLVARAFGDGRLPVRYEDLVADATGTVLAICDWVGTGTPVLRADASSVTLETSHGISGNPMRFAVGDVGLKLDDEWVAALPTRDRILVTTLTMPSLIQNRYHIFTTRRGDSSP